MKQRSLAESGYERRSKPTKRQRFLAEMEAVIPWARLVALASPAQPQRSARGGRKAFAVETMLRIHFMQQWFALSDPGMEEALHDIPALRHFAGLDAGDDLIPDESSILRFRHRLEKHGIAEQLLGEVNALLTERGLLLRQGTIVDASLINAPSSTKNQDRKRDPEMHQTKKGNQWYFGMKAHISVDTDSGLTHTVVATAGNVSDVSQTESLLHGEEQHLHGDAGYQLGAEREQRLRDKGIAPQIAARRSRIKVLPEGEYKAAIQDLEKAKASIRAKVEHPFHLVKNRFGYRKARYRGLAKNLARLFVLFMSANLVIAKKWLFSPDRQVASAA